MRMARAEHVHAAKISAFGFRGHICRTYLRQGPKMQARIKGGLAVVVVVLALQLKF